MKRTLLHIILIVLVMVLLVTSAGSVKTNASAPLQATQQATGAAAMTSATVDIMMKMAPATATGEPIPIGAIADLTGPTSDAGKPYSLGQQAYIDWLNSHGGINGRPIKLSAADYAYKVDQAQQLYTQYTTQDHVVLFMGWGTGDTEALRTKVAEDEMPFVSASFSASLNDPAGQAPYNFVIATTYSDQAVLLLDYLLKQTKDTAKIAFVYNDSPFGTSPLDDAEAFLKTKNVESLRVPMPKGATDFTAQIAQVNQFGATHVIFQNLPTPPAAFINQATAQGLKVTWGCLNYCADEIMIKLAKDKAEGMYGTIPFAPPTLDIPGVAIVRQYAKEHNVDLDAQGLHYVQGWWVTAVMVEAVKRTLDVGKELTGPNIKATLESMKDFDTGGVTPPITFTPTDHRANRATRIYQVKDGKWVAVTDYLSVPEK